MNACKPLVAAIATFLVTLAPSAPALAVEVLVRPMTPGLERELEALRERLRVGRDGETRLADLGARLWSSPLDAARANEVLAPYRERIAAEVLRHDHRVLAWPATEAELTPAAKESYGRIAGSRAYAPQRGFVRLLPKEFSRPLLQRGLPRDKEQPAGSVRFQLFKDVAFTATRVGIKGSRDGMFAWVGELGVRAGAARYDHGFMAATYHDGHLYARIEHGGAIYQLVPLGDRFHLVLRVDPVKVPDRDAIKGDAPWAPQSDAPAWGDCGEGDRPVSTDVGVGEGDRPVSTDVGVGEGDRPVSTDVGVGEGDRPVSTDVGVGEGDAREVFQGFCPQGCVSPPTVRGQACSEGPRTCAVVRLGVAFTAEAMAQLPALANNARHYGQYLVDLTSASFVRSGVHARLVLGAVSAPLRRLEPENPDPMRVVNALTMASTGAVPASAREVREWRDQTGSDLVMVLTSHGNIPGMGEVAGWSPPKNRVRDAQSGYSVVVAKYADAQLSFLHELGHHFGAYHDPKAGTGRPPFSYAQGFRHGCEWRSVMAYGGGECTQGVPRLAMWSSCNLWYRGVPVGSGEQNNVRIINRMSGWIAGFRP